MLAKKQSVLTCLCLLCAMSIAVAGFTAEPNVSFLDNGVIRLGVNLNAGGAITYLSKSGENTNLVNDPQYADVVKELSTLVKQYAAGHTPE